MFKTLTDKIIADKDLPARARTIDILTRVLNDELYDVLAYPFHMEKNDAGEYILMRDRRPSVQTGIIKTVVDDSVSLLFSEGHFPEVATENEDLRDVLAAFIKESNLNWTMIEAATIGSVGSVVLWMRVLKGRVFIEALNTTYLTPTWQSDAPDTLEKVTERRKAKGQALRDAGYAIDDNDLAVDFWFEREWDDASETWYLPRKVKTDKPSENARQVDANRTVNHKLGFVPMVWVKNLPGGDTIDGAPTMTKAAINTVIEVDYLLSQGGRGLKYSADPTLLIKEPAVGEDGQLIRSAGNALQVSSEGDAKLLEINGTAASAILEYTRGLTDRALASMHGNRSNPDKMTVAQSGRALELMHQALIWLADRLRISYGEGALLSLLKMVVKASKKFELTIDGKPVKDLPDDKLSLTWPHWFAPTFEDLMNQATGVKTLRDAKAISGETATRIVAADYDIEDVDAERTRIDGEATAETDRQIKLTQATKPVIPAPMG